MKRRSRQRKVLVKNKEKEKITKQFNASTIQPTKQVDTVIDVDPQYFRPTEVNLLLGDPTKAQQKLGWKHEYDIEALVKDMVKSDIEEIRNDK